MTKQEQIEEIQKIIDNSWEFSSISAELGSGDGDINVEEAAKALYEAGYRKIKEKNETLKKQIKHLNTIVERLDELLGKGINDYIMGIDGVEGLKDMWERSAVMEFAEKVKAKLFAIFGKTICSDLDTEDITDIIDELLKEYE